MQTAILLAALLAMVGAAFGVLAARALWAEDLDQAKRIDEIRSKSEASMRGTITALENRIAIYERWQKESKQ